MAASLPVTCRGRLRRGRWQKAWNRANDFRTAKKETCLFATASRATVVKIFVPRTRRNLWPRGGFEIRQRKIFDKIPVGWPSKIWDSFPVIKTSFCSRWFSLNSTQSAGERETGRFQFFLKTIFTTSGSCCLVAFVTTEKKKYDRFVLERCAFLFHAFLSPWQSVNCSAAPTDSQTRTGTFVPEFRPVWAWLTFLTTSCRVAQVVWVVIHRRNFLIPVPRKYGAIRGLIGFFGRGWGRKCGGRWKKKKNYSTRCNHQIQFTKTCGLEVIKAIPLKKIYIYI